MSKADENTQTMNTRASDGHYETVLARRQEWLARQRSGQLIIDGSIREFTSARQGRLKYLLHPYLDQVLADWAMFIHEISSESGRHTHQGGIILFVVQGRGYSIMNDVRYDWKEGDLIVMPLVKGGVEHQHFNLDPDRPAQWIAFRSYWVRDHIGSELRQQKDSPEWERAESETRST